MRDLNKLQAECPEVNTFDALDTDNIMFLYDYFPWNVPENVNYVTFKIRNLKKNETESVRARHHSVRFFSKALKNSIMPLINLTNVSACIVPKSREDELSFGMLELLGTLQNEIGFTNTENLLRRTTTVAKAAAGGARSVEIHKDSIEVINIDNVKNKNIFLFDDVTTTGCSLEACKQLLMEAGANQVIMIALAKTR